MTPKVILAGGSGFLGLALAQRLAALGREVVILSREPRPAAHAREVAWDGRTAGAWAGELEGAAALVNFTGRSINCVPTPVHQREIIASRVQSIRALGAACERAAVPPAVWIQCSAVGFYGDRGAAWCDEAQPPGTGFLPSVCVQWERAFAAVPLPRTRRVIFRLGTVLDRDAGVLPQLARVTRLFLGGAAGSGRQYLSWVHREDAIAAFAAALAQSAWEGTYNLCAPEPVTNAEFMRELRHVLKRPWAPPAPAPLVGLVARHILHTNPDLALLGQRCRSTRVQNGGFNFSHPTLAGALRDLFAATR